MATRRTPTKSRAEKAPSPERIPLSEDELDALLAQQVLDTESEDDAITLEEYLAGEGRRDRRVGA